MATWILNLLVGGAALAALFLLWGGVHLVSRKRFGDREFGCSGPVTDAEGNTQCCKGPVPCEDSEAPPPAGEKEAPTSR